MKKAIAAALFTAFAGPALAEAQHGIEVYPAAKADEAIAKQLKQKMNLNAKTYRTTDSVKKVTEFYRKQKLTEGPASSDQGAMFMSKSADVTIQSPWMDMSTNKINNDTLISIVGK